MKRVKLADMLAKASVSVAKFVGCEAASIAYSKQPQEPKSVKTLKTSK